MTSRTRSARWLGLLALVASCQSPPDISGEIQDYADLVSDANSLACECPQDLGFPTIAECDDAYGAVDTAGRQCLTDTLEGHEVEAREYLVCANAAYGEYVDCLAANGACEPGGYESCSNDHGDALAACPQLPAGISASFDACATKTPG